jgi:hypothetical protein
METVCGDLEQLDQGPPLPFADRFVEVAVWLPSPSPSPSRTRAPAAGVAAGSA